MQKQRTIQVEHFEDLVVATPARPARRLAAAGDVSGGGPARRLQADLAHAFAADAGWSVKRTVAVGLVFHLTVLGALAVAAGALVPQIVR